MIPRLITHREQGALGMELIMTEDINVCTVTEAAKLLRVSPATIRRLILYGKLPAARIGRSVRIERRTLILLITKRGVV